MNYRIILALVALGALSFGGLAYFKDRSRHTRIAPRDELEDIGAIRAELNELKAQREADLLMAMRMANRAERDNDARNVAPITAAPEVIEPKAPIERTAEAKAGKTELQIVSHLDDTFDGENVDANWSQVAALDATRALSGGLPSGSAISKVECRTSLCRVETTHRSLDAFRAYNEAAFLDRNRTLWNAGVYSTVRSESGSGVVAVSFIAKEGQSVKLPDAAEE